MRRIDKVTAEVILRLGIGNIKTSLGRIADMQREAGVTNNERKPTKLVQAAKRLTEAEQLLRDYAEANSVELRSTMKT